MESQASFTTIRRTFKGVVIADHLDKTVIVQVQRTIRHPLYGKSYKRSRKFKVHDADNHYHVGDVVEFVECRPLSKEKRWKVIVASL